MSEPSTAEGRPSREEPSRGDASQALHPLLLHHIVNALGWPSLRPLQHEALAPILAGEHALLAAPTAGGKTEAAIFPVLSRMLEEDWRGLSVLYLCPLRALLNNLHPRIEKYAEMVGRRARLWHGDVGDPKRERIRSEPPDILLTTPESLEAMLISRKTDHHRFFANVRAIVVDEIHAFAGDDRGWHLIAVAERIDRLATHSVQRIGLSATIGNAGEILEWLTRTSDRPRAVVRPPPESEDPTPPEVTVDFVGDLDNAATVISRLHRGEKRLVFVDSRARVEMLAARLRDRDVTTFVSHGSLGREERHAAEQAFAEARDCVIVSTSTLELGIDVGDLDRVIQIDAPPSVASFLQRLGRTGRRAGQASSTLFLTTREDAFLYTLGLLSCWQAGYVEPLQPPALPLHLLVQQVMALVLQEESIGDRTWTDWFGQPFALGNDLEGQAPVLTQSLVASEFLLSDNGILSIGPRGEQAFGRRHYMELMAVFSEPPMFKVLQGRKEIGKVPLFLFTLEAPDGHIILLAGRNWLVTHIDWRRGVVEVEPTELPGKIQWFGDGRGRSYELSQGVKRVLSGESLDAVRLSGRARDQLERAREEFDWLRESDGLVVRRSPTGAEDLWTFAGATVNMWLAVGLGDLADQRAPGDLSLRLTGSADADEVAQRLWAIEPAALTLGEAVARGAVDRLKFAEALPDAMARAVVEARLREDGLVGRVAVSGVRREVALAP